MNADNPDLLSNRIETLERRQRRASRWLIFLGIIVFLQAVAIAYLAAPFGGSAKHPLTIQAGRFEAIDRNGTVRAVLNADLSQTMLSMSDANGNTQILLRENDAGFATLEFFNRDSHDHKPMTLFTGSKRSFLELHDPKTRRHLNIQAGQGRMDMMQFDERGQKLP